MWGDEHYEDEHYDDEHLWLRVLRECVRACVRVCVCVCVCVCVPFVHLVGSSSAVKTTALGLVTSNRGSRPAGVYCPAWVFPCYCPPEN